MDWKSVKRKKQVKWKATRRKIAPAYLFSLSL
jgi:hypothetical protein